MKYFFLSLFYLPFALGGLPAIASLYGQTAGVPVLGAGLPGQQEIAPPTDLSASDGTYDQFVLIRWTPSEKASSYKVFRANKPESGTLQEISRGWQKSTWMCDYSALPDVDYFYTVVAYDGKQMSSAGSFDKGFIRKKPAVAIEEDNLLSQQDIRFGTDERKFFLMISNIEADSMIYAPEQEFAFKVNLENIFEVSSPRTELRYFLSKDARLDWADTLLGQKVLSSLPPSVKFSLPETVKLPSNLPNGDYYLIVVGSPDGDILQSKTGTFPLKIEHK